MLLFASVISDFFSELTLTGNSYVTFLTNLLHSIFGLFYVEATTVGDVVTPGHFTVFGDFALVGVVAGLVFFLLRFVIRFIKMKA